MGEFYFTEKGFEKLKNEIDKLEKLITQDIAKEIATAREHGDLKENAEYLAAKEKQAMYMTKLGQLQERFAARISYARKTCRPTSLRLAKESTSRIWSPVTKSHT